MKSSPESVPIPWVGTLPDGWVLNKLGRLVYCLDGRRIPLNSEERSSRPGPYPYWGANGILDHVDKWLFDEEVILLGEDGAPFFEKSKEVAFLVSGKIWVNNHAHVLRPSKEVSSRYLRYWLNIVDYADFIEGSTRDKLTQGKMVQIPVAVPPPAVQRRIAAFLDRKTAVIDELIKKKERLIELLQEKRQALITHEVTKGLDPSVPMTESSIPSIGPVPAHWRVQRNKVVFREANERSTTGQETLLTVSHLTGVTPRSEKQDVSMFLAESLEDYKLCEKDELAINTMWAWMGALGVSPCNGIVSPSYNVYRFRRRAEHEPAFFDLLFRTPPYVAEINRFSKGVWTSRLRLYPQEFLGMMSPVPPREEQAKIVAHVRQELAKDEALSAKLSESTTKLREYRQAVISAAVTGQLDLSKEDA